MTDIRLLSEFTARLAEREKFAPKSATRPKAGRKDWQRIENAHAEEASVYIFDEIGFWGTTAQSFVDELNGITAPKITVHINSPGGDVFDGLAIHTALAQSKAHVTTFVTGIAASAASYIAMAGDTIKTARNAMWMIHDASGLAWGNASTMRAQADLLDRITHNIADMYAMQAGGTADEWFARMENTETWYTGQEALAAGLADEMTDPDEEEEPEEIQDRLSLAVFNFSGKPKPPAPLQLSDVATVDEMAEIAWRNTMSSILPNKA